MPLAYLRLTSNLLELLHLRVDAHAEHQKAKRCGRCNYYVSPSSTVSAAFW